jgi:hypothetical protein
VTAASVPGSGPDGEVPPQPGVPARDETGAAADGEEFTCAPDDDWDADADADMARTGPSGRACTTHPTKYQL